MPITISFLGEKVICRNSGPEISENHDKNRFRKTEHFCFLVADFIELNLIKVTVQSDLMFWALAIKTINICDA